MSVTRELANNFKLELGKGNINFDSGEFRIILMDDAFVFDRDTHAIYSDISANELVEANGYQQLHEILSVKDAWQQDNVNNTAYLSWEDVVWTADGGDIGPTSAAVVLQYDSVDAGNSIIVGCISYDSVTTPNGASFMVKNIGFDSKQQSL